MGESRGEGEAGFEPRSVRRLLKQLGEERKEIEGADWGLTPGRYVGVAPPEEDEGFDFEQTVRDIHTELADLNKEAMVMLYWDIGRLILDRQEKEGWGARAIDRLPVDLREAYLDMRGLSPRNLLFMRSFAAAYPDMQMVKQLVSQLPWGHIIRLLQRIKDPDMRHWMSWRALSTAGRATFSKSRLTRALTNARARRSQTSRQRCRPPTVEEIEAELTREERRE